MNKLISNEQVDKIVTILSQAKDRLSMWSDNYATEHGLPQKSEDTILDSKLSKLIAEIQTLSPALTGNFGKSIREPKWDNLESEYFKITGETIAISSQVEYETYTLELNKINHLNV